MNENDLSFYSKDIVRDPVDIDILNMLCLGAKDSEISLELGIQEATVKRRILNLRSLTRFQNRTMLGIWWIKAAKISKELTKDFDLTSLTDKEKDVVLLVIDGLGNREIGKQLDIKESTVRVHLRRVFRKINCRNRTELAAAFTKR